MVKLISLQAYEIKLQYSPSFVELFIPESFRFLGIGFLFVAMSFTCGCLNKFKKYIFD